MSSTSHEQIAVVGRPVYHASKERQTVGRMLAEIRPAVCRRCRSICQAARAPGLPRAMSHGAPPAHQETTANSRIARRFSSTTACKTRNVTTDTMEAMMLDLAALKAEGQTNLYGFCLAVGFCLEVYKARKLKGCARNSSSGLNTYVQTVRLTLSLLPE